MTKQPESTRQITLNIHLGEATSGAMGASPLPLPAKLPEPGNAYAIALSKDRRYKEPEHSYIQVDLDLTSAGHFNSAPVANTPPNHIDSMASSSGSLDYLRGDDQGAIASEILAPGSTLLSPGGHFTYRIIGACCRLFDRAELPWPCCRIQWRSKEPSWRRIGKRFVPDLATKQFPSYAVEILDHEGADEPVIVTVYWMPLSALARSWWYKRYVPEQT